MKAPGRGCSLRTCGAESTLVWLICVRVCLLPGQYGAEADGQHVQAKRRPAPRGAPSPRRKAEHLPAAAGPRNPAPPGLRECVPPTPGCGAGRARALPGASCGALAERTPKAAGSGRESSNPETGFRRRATLASSILSHCLSFPSCPVGGLDSVKSPKIILPLSLKKS